MTDLIVSLLTADKCQIEALARYLLAESGTSQLSAVKLFFRKTCLHAQKAFISFLSAGRHINRLLRTLSGQCAAAVADSATLHATSVRLCFARHQLSILVGAALPYIPEAVPRLDFVDRRRGGRVSASAAARTALRSSDSRSAGETDLPSAKTGSLSAADGCDVAAAGASGPRIKDPRLDLSRSR